MNTSVLRAAQTLRRAMHGRGAVALLAAALLLPTTLLAAAQQHAKREPVVAPAVAPKIQPSAAAQMQVLRQIKTNKSVGQNKIDSRLFMGLLNQRRDARLAALPDFRFVVAGDDGRVPVEIILAGVTGMKAVLNKLEAIGAVVASRSYAHPTIQARVKLQDLEGLAALSDVRRVRQQMPAYTNAKTPAVVTPAPAPAPKAAKVANLVNTSEGVAAHGVDIARNLFGINGAGVKICVMSDGVDSLAASVASGDLPAGIDVLPGQAGTGDEGTAMLEIVHDVAPGATLGFATAFTSEASFAQNILDLATDGCNIIVDDIIYLDESPFQDGPVAQSVNTVTAAGVLYFSSAGNEGNKADATSGTWEGNFAASGAADPAALAGANLHNFGDGGNSIVVEAGAGEPPILIWAEHFDLTTGAASTDFDLYDMDGALATVFDASTDVQDGVGGDDFPIEFIGGGAFGGERLLIDRFAAGNTSSVPMFNLILFRGELADALSTGAATRGHSAAAEAYSVAATPAADPFDATTPDGPFPGQFTAANATESFSADGLRRIILSPTGVELTPGNRTTTGGVVRQKPDITAADGVATSAPGFNPFYGTSAAAPHAAAIAGLLKSALPAITPAQVRSALIASAIDIEGAGVDSSTGAGIIMAQGALEAAGATPVAFLTAEPAQAAEVVGDGDAYIEINEDFSLLLPLTNAGSTPATAISATLTTATPGIVITNAASTYTDAASAATVDNATLFGFSVTSAAVCGVPIEFTLTVEYSGGSVSSQTFDYDLASGAPGAPVAFPYAGGVVAIPDGADLSGSAPGAVITAPVTATGVATIYSASLSIDGATCTATEGATTVGIDHAFVNDLELTLTAPDATAVLAVNNTDGSGNNFCQTVLDDASAGLSIQSVATANAPFTGSFKPNAPFSAFAGKVGNGNWTLGVQDFFSGDTGNIRAFTLTLVPAVCDAPVQPPQLTATKTVAGSFAPGGAVTYTVTITNTGTGAQPDNVTNEFSDTLPAGLTVGTPTATSGTISAAGTDPVTWNGALAPGASVALVIPVTIAANATLGTPISNQASVFFDADRDGSNETPALSDDPGTPAPNDATVFIVQQGNLTITPAALAFGDVVVGQASAAQLVTLGNSGNAALQVTAITVAAPFAVTGGTCGAPPIAIAAGASCTVAVTFTPAAATPYAQSITITSDSPGSGDVALTGRGVLAGALTATPSAVDFGDVPVGTNSATVLVTLANSGGAAVQVTGIATPVAPFARVSGTCAATPFSLAAGASCTLGYRFTPTTAGAQSQPVQVTDSNGGNTVVTLMGTGTQAVIAIAPSAAVNFGTVQAGASAQAVTTIGNTGNAPLTITAISTPAAPFSLAGSTCGALPIVLQPGATCTLTYQFAPTANGARNAVVTLATSAGASQITLAGVGEGFITVPPLNVPTLSQLGLLLGIGLIALFGALGFRREL